MSDINEIRNLYYLGSYQRVINEAPSVDCSEVEQRIQRDVLIYKSYLAQGNYKIVLEEINDKHPLDLRAVLLFAKYLSDETDLKQEALETLDKWNKGSQSNNETFQLIAAAIYINENDNDSAFKSAHKVQSIEGKATMVQLYLKIDRIKNAEKELSEMIKIDDENPLTLLATAWVKLYYGTEEKAKEAFYIYQELIEKFGSTTLLLNGLSVANLQQAQTEDSIANLKESLERDPKSSDALINLASCYSLQNKFALSKRLYSQVKTFQPNHVFLTNLQQAETNFDKFASNFSPEVKN